MTESGSEPAPDTRTDDGGVDPDTDDGSGDAVVDDDPVADAPVLVPSAIVTRSLVQLDAQCDR